MTLGEKLEILLDRRKLKKNDFAAELGITYRALAHYKSGTRRPRGEVLKKMGELLEVSPEFLLDDTKNLVLTGEERFVLNSVSDEQVIGEAKALLDKLKTVLYKPEFKPEDMSAMFSCISSMYFDAKKKQVN